MSFIRRLTRTPNQRISALEANNSKLMGKLTALRLAVLPPLEKRVAYFALLHHVQRFQRALEDLPKRIVAESKGVSKLTDAEEKRIANTKEQLQITKQKLEESFKEQCPALPEQKKYPSTIMVAGAGGIGYFAAVKLKRLEKKHQSNVVLVSDKYADLPTRSGLVNQAAVLKYCEGLGLSTDEKHLFELMRFVALRGHPRLSIKHMDMIGRCVYQAIGGEIKNGKINLHDIKQEKKAELPSVTVVSEHDKEKKTIVTDVRCVVNAMGVNADYPEGVTRKPLVTNPILRTQCMQLNLRVSTALAEKLVKLRDHYKKVDRKSCIVTMKGHAKPGGQHNLQLYPLLTEQESKVLDNVVAKYADFYRRPELSESQQEETRLLLKTLLFIDFLEIRAGSELTLKDLAEISLRDQIKLGKHLCSAFEIPQPTAPIMEVCSIPKTNAVTTWVGAAALPPILNGVFMQYALYHANAVIDEIVKNEFKPDTLTNSYPVTNAFMEWLKLVRKHADAEKKHGDMAVDMSEYFNKRMQVGEARGMGNIFELLNVKKAEVKDDAPVEQPEGLVRRKSM